MILNKPYLLSKIKRLTPTVSSFVFSPQDNASIEFSPGMFAMLQFKGEQPGETVARAFSMANCPPSPEFEFLIALVHGKLTSHLENAKTGDLYYISAPYGQFKFDFSEKNKFLFLAGGTGLAPFISMLRYIKSKGIKADCRLIYSVKYPDEIINKDELEAFGGSIGLKTTVTVTRPQPGDGWDGEKGHVNAEMIKRDAPDCTDRISYICGPPAFVKALKDALISLGVNEKSIKAEMWGE